MKIELIKNQKKLVMYICKIIKILTLKIFKLHYDNYAENHTPYR